MENQVEKGTHKRAEAGVGKVGASGSPGAANSETGNEVDEDFQSLFEASMGAKELKEGEVVKGTVVAVTKDVVVIDVGYKSEGQVPIAEFLDQEGKCTAKVGEKVDVLLESRENDNGLIVLSKEKADKLQVWEEIGEVCERDETVVGTVLARVKGGLAVDIGVKAFLPGSQVDLRPSRNLDQYIGQKFQFKVIKFNKKRGNIVLSRRVLLERDRAQRKTETLRSLREGMLVQGTVKNITEYGAFVDLGGIDGLLHITDISWGHINHPSEAFNVGDEITVKVLKFNAETERVSLGLKQVQGDPWENVSQRFPVGTRMQGKVVRVQDFGAFVELEPGIEGLVRTSEMSWTKHVRHPSKVVNVGDMIEVVVLDVDAEAKKIALGMKQIEPNPWYQLVDRYPIGTRVTGAVRNITDFGVFIGIEDGIDGLIHKSDISWLAKVNHPSEIYKKGDNVEAVVLHIDPENERFSLGVKQLSEDPWDRIPREYPAGKVIQAKVTKVTDFGCFVELEPGVEGLIHVSEMADHRVEKPSKLVREGEMVSAEIIAIDGAERRIALSMKGARHAAERGDVAEYLSKDTRKSTTQLGELFAEKLGGSFGGGTPTAPEAEAAPVKPKRPRKKKTEAAATPEAEPAATDDAATTKSEDQPSS
ncbi:MAG: 30S ribosomal protein S1 [Deltaproteobacteria bacterium]|nr:30S ribosomal protein S1 [Deltaproteobacteria bacterium]